MSKKHLLLRVFQQNQDGQFRSFLMIELGTEPSKLHSVLNFDGMPITADFILGEIGKSLKVGNN